IEGPKPDLIQARGLQLVGQRRPLALQLIADDYSGSFARARKIYDFLGRALRIDRNTSRAGLQHAEISHAPFRRVVTEQHYPRAVADALAGKEGRRARGQLTQISVGVL